MGLRIPVEIPALPGMLRGLDGLKPAKLRKHNRAAMRKATSIVSKEAKARAPVGPTGQLRRSYGPKVKVYPGSGVVLGIVEPRAGFNVPVPGSRKGKVHMPRKVAHLAERGTGPRVTKGGASRGAARAQAHLQPGFQASVARVEQAFAAEFDKALAAV